MADAVMRLFPEAKLGVGPPTEDGFYYDMEVSRPFTPDDLDKLTQIMNETIAEDLPFIHRKHIRSDIEELYGDQPYKLEIISDIQPEEDITTYSHGSFSDLCQGPHVPSTGQVLAFKLLSVAGAYWRGSEDRPMLQRIYGTAFESQEALEEFLVHLEEAEKRDHRKLGRQLGLFSLHDEIGPGLIVWHPKGALIRSIMESYWQEEHYLHGYELVNSPHLGRARLWETSGHLDFYQESMYPAMEIEGQKYFMKPMNCPFHIMVYQSTLRSYRDLPLRIAELGTVYRYERSGVLHGLMRVRGFTQDDAHIFCQPDQVDAEILGVLAMTFRILEAFGFNDYHISLSTRPEKSVGDNETWDHATQALRKALELENLDYQVDEGGGAFYGPKIDVSIRDAIGRLWQCATVQFDFNLPERFDLTFRGSDGTHHRPYMIHRAILGSLERFLGILIEHHSGAFPLWLAPVQTVVIPIADRHVPYGSSLRDQLASKGFRVTVDERSERMNLKIREAQLQKVPYMLIVGDRETEAGGASLRDRDGHDFGTMSLEKIVGLLEQGLNP